MKMTVDQAKELLRKHSLGKIKFETRTVEGPMGKLEFNELYYESGKVGGLRCCSAFDLLISAGYHPVQIMR